MTKAMDTAKEFNKELLNHPLVIEYKKYASIINSNSKYKELDLKLRSMQKEIINNYSLDLVNEYDLQRLEKYKKALNILKEE